MKIVLALALLCALPVMAQSPANITPPAVMPPPGQMITAQQYLPDKPGVVSWKTLSLVQPIRNGNRIIPEFDKSLISMNGKEVKVHGFMMPLDIGDKQKRFLLSAAPPHCTFCIPGGPETFIEVLAKTAVRYGFDAVVVSGKLQILKDDPMGLYYRVTDAVAVP